MHNRVYTSRMRTELKKARLSVDGGNDIAAAIEQTRKAVSLLDKSASKGIVHKNNAARRKSRLMKRLAELESQKAS